MRCFYHPDVESREFCSTCSKALCPECSHQIKGKFYCQDCLVRGTEWAAAVKNLRIPDKAPQRAAWLSLIPGIGAVYNGQYQKALTQFAVFASLSIMSDSVHEIFGFGAFVFLIFTMFDSYRSAETNLRLRLEQKTPADNPNKDKTVAAWGVLLISLGSIFLLKNFIPYDFIHRLWPIAFIALGGYLVYRAIQDRDEVNRPGNPPPFGESKN